MGAQLRPVEAATGGDDDEEVIVIASTHDDRAQEGPDRDALELGAVLGALRALRPDDAVRRAGGDEGVEGGRRRIGFGRHPPTVAGAFMRSRHASAGWPASTVQSGPLNPSVNWVKPMSR